MGNFGAEGAVPLDEEDAAEFVLVGDGERTYRAVSSEGDASL